MPDKPLISLILVSINPQWWTETYNSLNIEKEVPFEIIALGPVKPDFDLPDNFYYYYTGVKCPQCVEAGYRIARGDYVISISDDSLFKPDFLRALYSNIQNNDMDNTFLLIRAARHWKAKVKSLYYKSRHKLPPDKRVLIGLYNYYKKEVVRDMGGFDRRFILGCYPCDLALRFYEKGGRCVIADPALICEGDRQGGSPGLRTFSNFIKLDLVLLDSWWENKKGDLVIHRKSPVEQFEGTAEDLLKETQGPRGKW